MADRELRKAREVAREILGDHMAGAPLLGVAVITARDREILEWLREQSVRSKFTADERELIWRISELLEAAINRAAESEDTKP